MFPVITAVIITVLGVQRVIIIIITTAQGEGPPEEPVDLVLLAVQDPVILTQFRIFVISRIL